MGWHTTPPVRVTPQHMPCGCCCGRNVEGYVLPVLSSKETRQSCWTNCNLCLFSGFLWCCEAGLQQGWWQVLCKCLSPSLHSLHCSSFPFVPVRAMSPLSLLLLAHAFLIWVACKDTNIPVGHGVICSCLCICLCAYVLWWVGIRWAALCNRQGPCRQEAYWWFVLTLSGYEAGYLKWKACVGGGSQHLLCIGRATCNEHACFLRKHKVLSEMLNGTAQLGCVWLCCIFPSCRMPLHKLNRCRMQCRGQALAFRCFAELKPELEGLDTERLYMLKPPCLSLSFQKQANPKCSSWDSYKTHLWKLLILFGLQAGAGQLAKGKLPCCVWMCLKACGKQLALSSLCWMTGVCWEGPSVAVLWNPNPAAFQAASSVCPSSADAALCPVQQWDSAGQAHGNLIFPAAMEQPCVIGNGAIRMPWQSRVGAVQRGIGMFYGNVTCAHSCGGDRVTVVSPASFLSLVLGFTSGIQS